MSKQRGGQKKICPIVCRSGKEEVTFDIGRASCIGTNYPEFVRQDCGSDSYVCPGDEEVTQKCKNETTENIRDTKHCNEDEYLINTCETPRHRRNIHNIGGKYKNKKTKKQMKNSKSKRTKHMKKSKKNTRK